MTISNNCLERRVILSEIGMEPRGTLSKSVAALIAVSDTIDFIGY